MVRIDGSKELWHSINFPQELLHCIEIKFILLDSDNYVSADFLFASTLLKLFILIKAIKKIIFVSYYFIHPCAQDNFLLLPCFIFGTIHKKKKNCWFLLQRESRWQETGNKAKFLLHHLNFETCEKTFYLKKLIMK